MRVAKLVTKSQSDPPERKTPREGFSYIFHFTGCLMVYIRKMGSQTLNSPPSATPSHLVTSSKKPAPHQNLKTNSKSRFFLKIGTPHKQVNGVQTSLYVKRAASPKSISPIFRSYPTPKNRTVLHMFSSSYTYGYDESYPYVSTPPSYIYIPSIPRNHHFL